MRVNLKYLFSTLLLMVILPIVFTMVELHLTIPNKALVLILGKWLLFWGVGCRLFIAGIRQITKPSFTAQSIFNISGEECFVVIRELGMANICAGLTAIISLMVPQWQTAAAFMGGLYFGLAGVLHIARKHRNANEIIPMLTDFYMLIAMAAYLLFSLHK